MDITTVLFYAFSLILVFAATRVVTARNPVHAALFLVLSFFSAAAVWLLLRAEFLAIVLVLVYVGAVMVLFLFVVMMVDIDIGKLREGFWSHFPLAAVVGVLIALQMAAVLLHGFWDPSAQAPAAAANIGGTKELGLLIYTEYIYAFEIAAVILLLAIVAAVALTLRRRKDTKYFDPAQAVKVRRNDRVRMVSMKAESNRANGTAATAAASAEKQ
ncbi:NADH-quinone oxidoreductase subunit J [Noviherbaspirillum aridicola]|uniref:NADH-quinone oxidoreductase subunit J n=1 Tax=Noviherbaspirillum aridicola TaxID=2849687 RepID=A0ABQ4Q5I8_9BURK|nr:NADH-quinone oxidoreductase subunit J [Noviherbaspirillum aridicola]GIZ52471.1 NADH-quinone oxidoreductase subunit J [Noviherbaspirillum aridicola]